MKNNAVRTNPLSPFNVNFINQNHLPEYWHPETELYFILSGEVHVTTAGNSFHAKSEDIFLINANDARIISGSAWEAVVITFRQDMLPSILPDHTARFEFNSAGNTYATKYDFIRYCIARLAEYQDNNEKAYTLLSVFYAMYSHLLSNFSAVPSRNPEIGEQNRGRLLSIINYINIHYRENLSLSETAAAFSLSSPYFSAFFKKHSGRTFIEYYNEIRLSHAINSLLSSGASIESIALSNGFSDSRSFTSLFKKKFGMLPNAYRKANRQTSYTNQTADIVENQTDGSGVKDLASEAKEYPVLSKYISVFNEDSDFINTLSENPKLIDAGSISNKSSGDHLSHNFHNMICVGSAKQFLYSEIQDMLRRMQKEIHFNYVKFHGLLSDDMMVYTEDSSGTPHYSFVLVDKALDFMLSIGLRPLCQLSFMPIALAQDPGKLMDFYHYNTSPPKDMKKWADLVEALVLHLINRYGLEEVKHWLFCVWNEPDETVDEFAWSDKELFFRFYDLTYKTVKKICPDLIFGTPSMLLSVQKEAGWAGDFFKYAVTHDCNPDFMNIHYYDNSLFAEDSRDRVKGEKGYLAENMESSFPLTVDPYAFMKFISNVKGLMKKHNMRNNPIYLTEWNLTISHRDLINDTCFKSCHLVKNLLENYDRLKSFGYWCVTDFIEELLIPDKLYHGGLGLFTYNGIPKANYNAFKLLSRLGDELLTKGDGYFVTRSKDRVAIMLYNYEHYSKLFAAGHRTEQDNTDRYSPFEEKNAAQFTIRLTDLDCSSVLIKEFYVNQYAGSSYDTWAQMGSKDAGSEEDFDLLMQQSSPGLYIHKENVDSGTLTVHTRMAPLEVRLVEIEYIL